MVFRFAWKTFNIWKNSWGYTTNVYCMLYSHKCEILLKRKILLVRKRANIIGRYVTMVVPSELLKTSDCYCNIKACSLVEWVKYITKYILKGSKIVILKMDEIEQYHNERSILSDWPCPVVVKMLCPPFPLIETRWLNSYLYLSQEYWQFESPAYHFFNGMRY